MLNLLIDPKILSPELSFRTSRSSGAGGQHVNKVETRVELLFDVEASTLLSDDQRALIRERLSSRINKEGVLILSSQESRSQHGNKEAVTEKFYMLIADALRPRKKRKPSRVPQGVKEHRLKVKKQQAEKKALRGRVDW